MNDKYTIEKGVPMTPRGYGRNLTSPLSITLKAMEIGDSIILTQRERNSAFAIAHSKKIKLSSRRTDGGIDQIRVWRVA